jgi:hypothetical protein
MKINNASSGEDTATTRGGDRRFTDVLNGDDDAKDNFRLIHAQQRGEFAGPRHRHNFDQLRYCISGAMNYGPNCWINAGELAYYPEGAYYGPEVSDKEYVVMALQFGGPSGLGFVSSRKITQGMEELKAQGTFEKGIFRRSGDTPAGTRRNQDAFEAVWEHLNGKRLEYPVPRYPMACGSSALAYSPSDRLKSTCSNSLRTVNSRYPRALAPRLEFSSREPVRSKVKDSARIPPSRCNAAKRRN